MEESEKEKLKKEKLKKELQSQKEKEQRNQATAQSFDVIFLSTLHQMGPQTKLQLMRRGLRPNMIDSLLKRGILVREYNPAINLNYLRVSDDYISS